MKEELIRLLALYEVDKEIDELRVRKDIIPQEIQELEQQKIEADKNLREFIESIKHLELLSKRKELDLATLEEQLRKHEAQLLTLKSNEEYQAMLKQIEMDKERISSLEDELLDILEKIEDMQSKRPEVEKETARKIKDIDARIAKLKEELNGIDGKVKLLDSERERRAYFVPKKLLSRYERLRKLGKKDAVVPIVDESCGGCGATIPIQTINEIRASGTVGVCENCGRLIYWPYEEIEK